MIIFFFFLLQNYLRYQPDNLKSYDLVSEVSQFVSVLYTNITGSTIELLALVFETLNELSQVGLQPISSFPLSFPMVIHVQLVVHLGDNTYHSWNFGRAYLTLKAWVDPLLLCSCTFKYLVAFSILPFSVPMEFWFPRLLNKGSLNQYICCVICL